MRIRPALLAVAVMTPLLACARPADQHEPLEPSPELRVVMLGTGDPTPNPERSGPAVAIVVADQAYLVDAGAGIMRRAAAAAARLTIPALEAQRVEVVFLTHLHSDHTIGLADVIFTGWTMGRDKPLRVYGPPGTKGMVDHLLAAYGEDIQVRLEGPQPATARGFEVVVQEIAPGEVYRDDHIVVHSVAVPHVNWRHAYGYRFEGAGRVVVVSGDTGPSEDLADACNGCDLLVHEVYSAAGIKTAPEDWRIYFAAAHTSTDELAGVAHRARPRMLLLYHQMYWGATDAALVSEVNAGWPGLVVSADDLRAY